MYLSYVLLIMRGYIVTELLEGMPTQHQTEVFTSSLSWSAMPVKKRTTSESN